LGVLFPVNGLGYEAVSDISLFFVVDVIAHVVAFLENLPRDVADEPRERDKEKFFAFPFSMTKLAPDGVPRYF